jgi:hypothetical protein
MLSLGYVAFEYSWCAAPLLTLPGNLQDFQKQIPEMPCAAPFAALLPGSMSLRLSRSFLRASDTGASHRIPSRLLARAHGRFFADIDLHALLHTKHGSAPSKVSFFCRHSIACLDTALRLARSISFSFNRQQCRCLSGHGWQHYI